jgi:integrase
VLVLAARLWRDEYGRPWLAQAPLIQQLRSDARKPYPISCEEQSRLLAKLPRHLADMALFALNTGCRENKICALRWREEVGDGLFLLAEDRTKNKAERIVVLNSVARNIIDARRGIHGEFVFTYLGNPVTRMNNHAWRKARARASVPMCRVHDLRHTFGSRLRAAGVSHEDRKDLLGRKSREITTHYSKAEVSNLMAAVERLTECRESISVIGSVK